MRSCRTPTLINFLGQQSQTVCLDEPGFSSLQSESWAKFAHRISNMLDWTKAAAGLGFRSAADKLKNQQVVHERANTLCGVATVRRLL